MRAITITMLLVMLALTQSAAARDGDTLVPIEIDAPLLITFPDSLLTENDFSAIEGRIREARNSGVPLAVRVVDLSANGQDVPREIHQLPGTDLSQLTQAQINGTTQAWIDQEPVETTPGADDGILLLVIVPEDRTQTQAYWRIGPNALPLNSLTAGNIAATVPTMEAQFKQGFVANGVYQGLLEFGSNIQFGVPERRERTTLQDALHTAMIPLAIITAMAGVAIPLIAWRLGRKSTNVVAATETLSAWEIAAIEIGRVSPAVTTAMLLEAIHDGSVRPTDGGGLLLSPEHTGPVVDVLRPFASDHGVVPRAAVLEIEGITQPIRLEMEDHLASIGAFTDRARTDRTWILLLMGIATFLIALGIVPIVVSMSALGILGIVVAVLGITWGWWWLEHRSYTTEAGTVMMAAWLETASAADHNRFNLAVHQTFLIEQTGGPNTSAQMKLVRHLRGLGAH
ncbi:MAG: hypothetical protein M9934_01440 [Thermomicrobiales bacterium]|nr:hypothetical protein [Thermomicrobiales bacterium]MCO5226930.1 hypothetical protein [Thermomicrobiales bacterium]